MSNYTNVNILGETEMGSIVSVHVGSATEGEIITECFNMEDRGLGVVEIQHGEGQDTLVFDS